MGLFKDIRSYRPLNFVLVLGAFLLPVLGGASLPEDDSVLESESEFVYEDFNKPRFLSLLPRWGVEFTSSLQALGRDALALEQGQDSIYAFALSVEYQVPFQKFGIFSIGPSLALYPDFGKQLTSHLASIWSFGGQVRYQAHYSNRQWLVPGIAYSLQSLQYQFTNGAAGNVLLGGPVASLWLLLNGLDRSSAHHFYMNYGVLRSYAVLEYRFQRGNDTNISLTGGSVYFGLRVEI